MIKRRGDSYCKECHRSIDYQLLAALPCKASGLVIDGAKPLGGKVKNPNIRFMQNVFHQLSFSLMKAMNVDLFECKRIDKMF